MNEVCTDGHIVVDGPLVFRGTAEGSMTVTEAGTLHLLGICKGSLHVHKGGLALVHGIVEKNVFNEGIVELRGRVDGDVNSQGAAFVRLHRGHVCGRTFV
jgi:hypothetical protein